MSGFVNAGDNGCSLGNSIVKTTTLLLFSPIGIRDILSVNDVDIVQCQNLNPETIREYILQLCLSRSFSLYQYRYYMN